MVKDGLGTRMRGYETPYQYVVTPRLPVIVRVDGRAFHTLTKGMDKPFDSRFSQTMRTTAMRMCSQIAGAKFAYTQSDEISILVMNDDRLETQPFLGNNLSKLVSITASMATSLFINQAIDTIDYRLRNVQFDSRVFTLPPGEVVNYFIWRQQDAIRNSIQSLGQSVLSRKTMHGMNGKQIREELAAKGRDWEKLPTGVKYGFAMKQVDSQVRCLQHGGVIRNPKDESECVCADTKEWVTDHSPPVFSQNRAYILDTFRKPVAESDPESAQSAPPESPPAVKRRRGRVR